MPDFLPQMRARQPKPRPPQVASFRSLLRLIDAPLEAYLVKLLLVLNQRQWPKGGRPATPTCYEDGAPDRTKVTTASISMGSAFAVFTSNVGASNVSGTKDRSMAKCPVSSCAAR